MAHCTGKGRSPHRKAAASSPEEEAGYPMPRRQTADRLMSAADFHEHIKRFIRRYRTFHLTFLFEAGQGYHIVLHDGLGSKERIGVTYATDVMLSSVNVYYILKKELPWSDDIDRAMRRMLGPLKRKGSMLLIIENREVAEANFHRGELWP